MEGHLSRIRYRRGERPLDSMQDLLVRRRSKTLNNGHVAYMNTGKYFVFR
jgi:hypothetical protein